MEQGILAMRQRLDTARNSAGEGREEADQRLDMARRRRANAQRRKREVSWQRFAVAMLTVCVVLGGVLFGGNLSASGKSQASADDMPIKYYTSIRVESGDSLWSIARAHMGEGYDDIGDYIQEVKTINQLGEDEIHAGQYLTIPYFHGQ